ncbi:hypothetical protein K443DRAFT_133426 [Laccaria amethystina LaAM-08-1]|uniref:Major facilitator superfamily (MFS) profile domain-containing protein n=1 Tax=Laccaria amethystina LaAM-08-1 TaxID=1095629 RepID=A0A0C9XLS7_9AGAR|nr:hypothetical protein K443DRAFT_133426 [Laccaria amethystina LaAM-08-1]
MSTGGREETDVAYFQDDFDNSSGSGSVTPKEKRTPLPKVQLFVLFLIQFAEPITATVIYPFVNQFVRDTGIIGGDERKTGYYAGIIESLFFLAETLTVFQWGWLSDRYGRKPILLLGPLGLTFAMLCFGLSTTFWPLVAYRCMQGIFNGNIGVSKTVLGEITDSSNIADAFALIQLMWTSGITIGPILGGLLSNPAERWPGILGKIRLFQDHPYFLPCAAASLLAFSAFPISLIALKETLPDAAGWRHLADVKRRIMRWTSCSKEKSTPLIGSPTECCNYGSTLPFLSEGSLSVISSESTVTPTSQPPPFQAFLNRPLLMAFLNYGFLAFTDMSHAALLPLMYSTSIPLGGLGLDPFRIGTALGAFGFFNAFVQINFLGRLIRHFGPRGVYMVAYASFLICIGSYPIMSYFAKRAGKVDGIVAAIMTIQLTFQITISMAYGSIQIMFVEYAPGKAALGSTNGIGQMIASGMRSFAPTIASSLFSVSLQHKLVGGYMVYYILLGIIIVGMRLSVLLPTRPQTP